MRKLLGFSGFFLVLACFRAGGLEAQRSPLTPEEERILDQDPVNQAGCESALIEPDLDFFFRFAGALRLFVSRSAAGLNSPKDDAGAPRRQPIRVVGRITPLESIASPLIAHRTVLLDREQAAGRGKVGLELVFYVGNGKYRIDWLLRTNSGQICSGRKNFRARSGNGVYDVRPSLEPGHGYFLGQSSPEPWWYDRIRPGFRFKLILNVPPFKSGRPLTAADLNRIQGILTWLSYHPRVGAFELVVFNIKDQQVIYRKDVEAHMPDNMELARAIDALGNSEIRLETLEKNSESRFLSRLLVDEISSTQDFDAVVLIGPRVPLRFDAKPTVEEIRESAPVYYFKYRFSEAGGLWNDPLQEVTSKLGGRTFPVRTPEDLWESVERLIRQLGTPSQLPRSDGSVGSQAPAGN